jgi:cobalt-zinc-cadmium efflux system outer membrane protein
MKKVIVCLIVLWMTASGATGFGIDSQKPEEIGLGSILREARDRNPDIQAALESWRAAEEKIPQARAFPDPMLRYTLFGQSIETRLGPQRNKFSLAQTIPFFGKLPLQGKIASAQSQMSGSRYRSVVADVMLGVKSLYFNLLRLDRTIALLEKEMDVIDILIRTSTAEYEAGKVGQPDVLRAHLELTRLEDRMIGLRRSRRAAASQLNALLNRPPDTGIPPIKFGHNVPGLGDREELLAMALSNRPEISLNENLILMDRQKLDLSKKNFYPDFQVMVEYVDIGAGTTMDGRDGRDAWMASVGVTIPLWRRKLKAGRAEARTQLRSSERKLEGIQLKTEALVLELYDEISTAREQLGLYEDVLLPQAEQTLKASDTAYRTGQVDFLTLLESQRMILTIRMGMEKIFSDIWISFSRLERLMGHDLDPEEMGVDPFAQGSPDNGGSDDDK